ncbi:unnamed protein product [Rotaria sp. Silwood1]|nr:unnamed protein product [Rotaria sp. Silwood1]
MSNQQDDNVQLDDDAQGTQQPKQRSRNFYRKRPGSERQNQDLGEDENHALNDDDTQRSNHSDDNDDHVNNTRGRGGRRGGFRRFRGRGRFSRGIPFYGDFRRAYAPYTNYMNEHGGIFVPAGEFYGPSYVGGGDLPEQEGLIDYSIRGNRGFRGGRGRGRRRGQITKNETTDNNNINNNHDNNVTTNNNDQQQGENTNVTKRRNSKRYQRKQQRKNTETGTGTEQPTDDVVTDDQHQDENNQGATRQTRRKSNRQQRRRNTNASQNGAETDDRTKSAPIKKPKDDETIVKNVVRYMVNKVCRRLAPRYRRRSRAYTKETITNNNNINKNTDVEKPQINNAQRGRHSGRRRGNGYFIEQGYYDPYGMTPYYYGMYYGYSGRGYTGRGRGRGGRGRGRFRQRRGTNKENQPQNNSEQGKTEESNPTNDNSQSKTTISEVINQSLNNADSNQ